LTLPLSCETMTGMNSPEPDELLEARCNLAAIFRWSERLGLSEGICNHYSWMVDESQFLINPFGKHWAELRASDLLLVDPHGQVVGGDGEVEPTALFIHWRIHRSQPRARCVLHTHMPYATALTAINRGRLEMCCQNALRFDGQIAYDDDYHGLALDASEGDRLCRALGNRRILFLANHGVVATGPTIAAAFDDLYYLERAAHIQVLAQSTGQPLRIVGDDIRRKVRQQFQEDQPFAERHLAAIRRVLNRESPEYAA
jgi:ribulose-5-phosphate 4-epimerase/fuculose-1-phosphate aldolase